MLVNTACGGVRIDPTMELDAREIGDGAVLEADLCIIGAGPAGLSLAREFIGEKIGVLVLESGGREPQSRIQKLNDGAVVGDAYGGLRRSRRRAVGGTAHAWNIKIAGGQGAKYAPLDPYDFEERVGWPYGGWPFDYSRLDPYYRRAQVVCGLGPFAYDGEPWLDEEFPALPLGAGRLTTKVYHFGAGRIFTGIYPSQIRASANVTLCHHATACGLETENAGSKVVAAKIASSSGGRFVARARIYVLAAGAIENARLLLVSGGADAPGNRHGWVGRCFMEHLRDDALALVPASPELFGRARFYDAHAARDGSIVGGRLAPADSALREHEFPNWSVTLFPRLKVWRPAGITGRVLNRLRLLAGERLNLGYGWSRAANLSARSDAFRLLINLEQKPDPENRVTLDGRRDFLGVPQAGLEWRWRAHEQAALERLRGFFARAVEAAGLGRVETRARSRPDPNAHHHAGTTRMHEDPRRGVVDADGRVHECDNLYAAGGSVFPTAGFVNPTLTIVALALRLADHLKRRI